MKMLAAALAALMLAAAVPARADSAFMTTGHELRASKLVGITVTDTQSGTIGTIDDVLLSVAGKSAEAVVNVGSYVGGGEKLVVVPLSHLRFSASGVSMATSKSELSAMKEFSFHMASDSSG